MATNTAGNAPVGTQPKANKAKAKSWVGSHKLTVGAILVVLLGLYYFVRHSSSANGSATTDTTGGANTGTTAVPAGDLGLSSDPSSAGFFDPNSVSGLMTQLLAGQAGLADAIGGLSTATGGGAGGATAPAGSPTPGTPAGSGSPTPTTGTTSGTGAGHPTTPTPKKVTAKPPPKKKKPVKPKPTVHTYTVKRGDSLASIAARLHIAGGWHTLYAKNKHAVGGNPNLIHAGLVLHY